MHKIILIYWYIDIYIDIVINWYWYIGIDILINVCLILKIKVISYNMTMTCIHHAHWCSQPQNMTLIHHTRMSHQPNDTKYKICCHYAEMLINILNHPIKIKHESSFSAGGGPPADPRGGAYQSVTSTKGRGNQGEGDRDESPFSRRGGGPWWVTQSGVGGPWWVIQRGGTREEGGSTNQIQVEGVGGRLS